jgi:hypothetical protein
MAAFHFFKVNESILSFQCPAGKAWPGETSQERSEEEAHGPPAERVRLWWKSTEFFKLTHLFLITNIFWLPVVIYIIREIVGVDIYDKNI